MKKASLISADFIGQLLLPVFGNYTYRGLLIFDDQYFLWFEEVDFCRQIKKAGGQVWYTPVTQCTDFIGQSFIQLPLGQAQKHMRDSSLKYFQKWHKRNEYWILRLAWPFGIFLANIGKLLGFKKRANT